VGSSESKAKGSFGQKEFYFSIMGETALEEEPRARGTLNIVIFLIKKKSSNFKRRVSIHFVAKTTTCCICMWKLSFLKYGNTHLISELYYKIGR
jgi:hypothetical protein